MRIESMRITGRNKRAWSLAAARALLTKRQQKTVRFSETPVIESESSDRSITDEDRASIWYTREERKTMRRAARRASLDAVTTCPQRETEVFQAYEQARNLADVMDELDMEKLIATSSALAEYSAGTPTRRDDEYGETCRGLEDWMSKKHRRAREHDAKTSRMLVVELSKLIKKRSRPFDDEFVAYEYQDAARASAVMARLLAEADAIAASKA